MSRFPLRAVSILKLVGVASLVCGTGLAATVAASQAGAQPGGTPTVQSTASIGGSGGISDSVTVTGDAAGGAPTGNVSFYLCQTGTTQTLTAGPCASVAGNLFQTVRLTTGSNDTSTAASAIDSPRSAGTWCFSASYGGSNNYDAASDNTSGSNLDSSECVVVPPASSTSSSTISAAVVTLGASDSVNDTVTVQGTAPKGAPSGTVTFYACQTGSTQAYSPSFCTPSGTPEDTETVQAGADDTSSATSVSFTPNAAGTWCFSAIYSGDNNYTGSSDNTTSGNLDSDECVLVGQASSTSATVVSPTNITLGPSGTLSDSVTVTGNSVGGPPTGGVTFYVCQTGSTQTIAPSFCNPSGTPESSEALAPASVDPNNDLSDATSATFTPSAAGTWCFSAVYGGDSNYTSSTDNTTSGNLDSSECALVGQAGSVTATTISSATVNVDPSGTVTDSVTVTGNSAGGVPQGTVDFYVCGPTASDALCTSQSSPEGTPTLAQASSDTSSATSSGFTPSATGVWCFAAVYVPAAGGNYTGSSDNVSGTVDTSECTLAQDAYRFTSASSTTATQGSAFTFTVSTTSPAGSPQPLIKRHGTLPVGVRFVNNGNGTATLHGTAKSAGTYNVTFSAQWGKNKKKVVATQAFVLQINS